MSLSQGTLESVRQRAQIAEIVAETVSLRRQGGRLVGLCPFHEENSPSFSVNPERGLFYCFGCHAGGDVFAFVMKRENLTFVEAVRFLAEKLHVPIESASPRERQREEALRALEAAAAFYEEALPSDGTAMAYLKRRSVDAATARTFRLGYAPDAPQELHRHLTSRGFGLETLQVAGLVGTGRDGQPLDRMRARLVFPIRDRQGRVTGFGGRLLDDRPGPKYLNSPDSPLFHKGSALYDLSLAHKAWGEKRRAVLVEGYMDVIALHQAGVTEAAASLGTALTPDQVAIFAREVEEVFVAYDGDAAGQAATMRGLWLLAASGMATRFVRLPAGEDPDTLVHKGGRQAWEDRADAAMRLIDYLTEATIRGIDVSTPQGKARAARTVLPGIRLLRSPVEQAEEVRRLALRLGVDEASLRKEGGSAVKVVPAQKPHKETLGTQLTLRDRIEMSIIKGLADDPDLVSRLGDADLAFALPGAKEVIEEMAAGRDPASMEDEVARSLWARVLVEDRPAEPAEELLKALRREGKRERLKELREDIREREARGEIVPAEMLAELTSLLEDVR